MRTLFKKRARIENSDIGFLKEIYRVMFDVGDISKYMQFEYDDHDKLQEMRIAANRARAKRRAEQLRVEYEPLLNEIIKIGVSVDEGY